jgi:hypothetical protein
LTAISANWFHWPAGAGVFVAEHQLHAGAAGRLAVAAAVEDHVLHGLATQLAGLAFAQHPAHGVHDVGLAAAVGADHAHQLAGQLEGGGLGEGLEARELDLIDARTRGEVTLRAWADVIGAPFLGVLRDTQNYVRCVERGLTIFDVPASRVQADRDQWQPLLDWLDPLWASQELGTPSQAGALEQPSDLAPAVAEVRRVVRAPGPARPVLEDIAAALRPQASSGRSEPRRWFGAGWWPWARA